MRFGYFDDQNKEYVITRPDTPLPWINYLGLEDYFGLISNTAGGYTFYRDARLRRLTRYRYNNVPADTGGRYIYIKNSKTKEFWSPTWQPIKKELDEYECRHGLGYTKINSTYKKIESKITYFVPLGEHLEVWKVVLSNKSEEEQKLLIFSCIEFALWDAHDDSTNFQRNLNIGEVEIEENTIFHKTEYRERRNHFAYFTCSKDIIGFDTQRENFLGPYRGWDNPLALETGNSSNSIAHGWSPIGSHHIEITLKPGESTEILFLLGYAENDKGKKFSPIDSQIINKESVNKTIEKFTKLTIVNDAFKKLKEYWECLLNKFQVKTPDKDTNRMINIWNIYQNMVTFNMSRSASLFESGVSRGFGFRDSNQDILGFLHLVPDKARERILDLAATQLENGGAYHQYQPLSKRGNDDIGSNFNDDSLWLVLSVSEYLKETGDFSILKEEVTYENKAGSEETLLKHLQRSINYIWERRGPHGLPLIGRADWNDCLNLNCFSEEPGESFQTVMNHGDGKTAESIFIASLFIITTNELAKIFHLLGDFDRFDKYQTMSNRMKEKIIVHGWDGEWFLRAYDSYSKKVGSQDCDEGKIFVESQGLCIMAGIGLNDGKAKKSLNSVKKYLANEHGIKVLHPPYSKYYPQLGEISSYPPGYKENASIFCHTNPWIMISEVLTGNGDQAFDYYKRINPSAREEISEVHRCEPYIYSQMIAGPDAPTFGEAKNSWLTGTAAWNYVALTKWILGIQATYDGLLINPVIPKEWKSFSAKRVFRGITFNFSVKRNGNGNDVKIFLDDQPLNGKVIPVPLNKEEVKVLVTIQ